MEDIDLTVLPVGQTAPLKHGADRHNRMLREQEFDICELSLSSYLVAKSQGMPFTAIPVFVRRLFSQSQMWINADAGIQSPKDLVGRKVGLSTFQTTLSVLAKGDIQAEYGVPWRQIDWYVANEEPVPFQLSEEVRVQRIPQGKRIGAMLDRGEIDAFFTPHPPREVRESSRIKRLFSDAKQEEVNYFRKNGFYPIMHLIGFKKETLERDPWIAGSVTKLFEEAKETWEAYYNDPNWSSLAWGRHLFEEEHRVLGGDPWPYGLQKNQANLERFMDYSVEQGLTPRKFAMEELFAESTLNT